MDKQFLEIKRLKPMTPFEDFLQAAMKGRMPQATLFSSFLTESFYMPLRRMNFLSPESESGPIVTQYDNESFVLIFSLKPRMRFFERNFSGFTYKTGRELLDGLPDATGLLLNPESDIHFFISSDKIKLFK